MNSQELESIIRSKVQDVKTLVVSDVSGGCGQAFDVIIVSPVFEGLPTLKRHRLVNDLLKDQIAQLHAFSQKTYTPAQYEALSGSNTTSAPAPAPSTTTSTAMSTTTTSSSSLLPKTPPPKISTRIPTQPPHTHGRSVSNVSIPELTLTTDDETLSGRAPSGAGGAGGGAGGPRPLTPSSQHGISSVDMHGSPSSPGGGGISRLHYHKITSVEFWDEIKRVIDSQFISQGSPAGGVVHSPGEHPLLASPSRTTTAIPNGGGGGAATAGGGTGGVGGVGGASSGIFSSRGEAEATRLFEDFFQSQKMHMSASDVAKVRDGTGMYGM